MRRAFFNHFKKDIKVKEKIGVMLNGPRMRRLFEEWLAS